MKRKVVYVQTTKSIGVVIDEGQDAQGKWYRTDCDGVRDEGELLFLKGKEAVRECIDQLKATIAPSTKQLIGIN